MTSNIRHSSESPKWGTNSKMIDVAHACLCQATNQPHIFVDPFSEEEFNAHVGARHILTGQTGRDGFKDRWLIGSDVAPRADHLLAGVRPAAPVGFRMQEWLNPDEVDDISKSIITVMPTALVNPPGSEDGKSTKLAWSILTAYWQDGWFPGGALWVGFSLNQLQTLQNGEKNNCHVSPLNGQFRRCIPSKRMPYTPHSSRPEKRVTKHDEVVDNDDAPSHPSFFVLLPSYDLVVQAEQIRLFDDLCSNLGEVF